MKKEMNFQSVVNADNREGGPDCNAIYSMVDRYLLEQNEKKLNVLPSCKEEEACACSGSDGSGMVDLIVLIDTSGSMNTSAAQVSEAAAKAIEIAKASCPTDLRIVFMGVEGVWPGTNFTVNHRKYLNGIVAAGTVFAGDSGSVGLRTEQGANAIEDLSNHFDWRRGACRAIFYISDEELDSINPHADFANENKVTAAAIAAANAQRVTVFAHHLDYLGRAPQIIQNYKDLCADTGGQYFQSSAPNASEYATMLSSVICDACGNKCKIAEVPDLHPCISVRWGDSECDCMESTDLEVMHITVSNCYENVTFSNFRIGYVWVTDAAGNPVTSLPEGGSTVQTLPVGPFCFGDIEPCHDGVPGTRTRQFVLYTRGARTGNYRLHLGAICYDVNFHYDTQLCFALTLCKD